MAEVVDDARASDDPVGIVRAALRIVGVLAQPRKTFTEIGQSPSWFLALLLLIFGSVVVAQISESRLDPESMRPFLEASGVPAEEIDQALDAQSQSTPGAALWKALAGIGQTGLFFVVASTAFWGLTKIFGSELSFRGGLAVTVHGFAPMFVAALLTIPVILSRESLSFGEIVGGELLASSAAIFADAEASPALRAILSSLDVFSIWTITLLTMGFVVCGRISRTGALVSVLVPWLCAVGLKVGFAALVGGMTSAG